MLNIWKIAASEDQILSFVSSVVVPEPATRSKFLTSKRILVSTTHGTIWSVQILKDSQGNKYLDKPIAVFRNTDLSTIWDFAIVESSLTGKQAESHYDVILASDSGEVRHVAIEFLQVKSETVLIKFVGQSALRLSIDQSDQTILTVGGNHTVKVAKLSYDE